MRNLTDIYWIAGLLDGEGCFGFHKSPQIQLNMIDLDIIERARNILRQSSKITVVERIGYKTQFKITIAGSDMIGWMMTIYPLMSSRRQIKIKEVINKWKNMSGYEKSSSENFAKGRAIKMLAKYKSISIEEAKNILNNSVSKTVQ